MDSSVLIVATVPLPKPRRPLLLDLVRTHTRSIAVTNANAAQAHLRVSRHRALLYTTADKRDAAEPRLVARRTM